MALIRDAFRYYAGIAVTLVGLTAAGKNALALLATVALLPFDNPEIVEPGPQAHHWLCVLLAKRSWGD
jgi:hypothetical protein